MSVLYRCTHLDAPHPPLPPSYPSSFADLAPLPRLYFCEECDAIRCDDCVAIEVASYYCPNCLFDVPGANVRADKNRCARSCFSCPQCSSSLTALASNQGNAAESSSRSTGTDGAPAPPTHASGAPYLLVCAACKWSSKEIGWEFDTPAGLASQVSKVYTVPEDAQTEFDALKDHLEGHLAQAAPPASSKGHHARTPSRHIAQITQAAARALRREMPGMATGPRTVSGAHPRRKPGDKDAKAGWDQLAPYQAKGSWKEEGLVGGMDDVDAMRGLVSEDIAPLEKRWANARDPQRMSSDTVPQRIPLQAKLTKRCPHPTCRHILIQPDTKTVRMLIKMVANNYLPTIEIGRRRRRLADETPDNLTEEDLERRRRERRRTRINLAREEDEDMSDPLRPGEVYTFQLAFTNPLYDPIQVRVGTAHQTRGPVQPSHHVFTPTSHFTVGALKDAWAYDEDEDGGEDEDEAAAGGGGGSGITGDSERAKARMSLGGARHGRGREAEVEKRGNVTKIALELEVLPGAVGPVEFDLEVRFTYRADDAEESGAAGAGAGGAGAGKEGGGGGSREEYKTFTFWVRVCAGEVL